MGVSKVDYFGETLVDMTDATVTEGTLLAGAKAYDAAGNLIEGAVVIAPIDSTLSVEGAAADAKATGDALAGTVKKSGDTMEGELIVNGSGQAGTSKIVLETGKGRITNSGINVLLGFLDDTILAVGYSSYALKLRGSASAPTYNGTNIALSGHTHQKVNNPDGVGFITLIKDGSYFFRAGDADNSYNCGSTNYRWTTVYAKNALNTSSDMRLKKDFSEDYSKYIDMLDRIRPTTFVRTNTGDGKRHTGYKAQAVLKAMKEAGLAEDDFAGFERHMQEEGSVYTYGLAYEEFIPVLHAKIKQLEERIRQLEEKEK